MMARPTNTVKAGPHRKAMAASAAVAFLWLMAAALLPSPGEGLSFTGRPPTLPRVGGSPLRSSGGGTVFRRGSSSSRSSSSLMMISTGDDRSERQSLDISKTTYISLIKSPKDAYLAVSCCVPCRRACLSVFIAVVVALCSLSMVS